MAWVQSQLCFLPPATHLCPGQVVICGDPQGEDTKEMLHCVRSVFSPNKVEVPPACQPFPGLCCLRCWCFILSPSAAVASVLLLCSAFLLLGSILSFLYLSTASRAMAEPLHPSPCTKHGQPSPEEAAAVAVIAAGCLHCSQPEPSAFPRGNLSFRCECVMPSVDASCPVQTQSVSGSPAAWRRPRILGRDEAVPHSSSGYHQLGEAGFSQSFSPIQQLLLCIGVPACLCLSSSLL